MAQKKPIPAVEELFRNVGKAHRDAFRDVEETDREWPLWYADRLHQDLVRLLDSELTKSRLVYLLVQGEKKRSKKKPKGDWPRYFARYLVKRLG